MRVLVCACKREKIFDWVCECGCEALREREREREREGVFVSV